MIWSDTSTVKRSWTSAADKSSKLYQYLLNLATWLPVFTMQDHSAVHVDHDPSGSYLNDVDPSAIGGKSAAELPPHYFRSWKFIGFTIVRILPSRHPSQGQRVRN